MRKIVLIPLLVSMSLCGPFLFIKNDRTVFQAISKPDRMKNETYVDQVMRDTGVCRFWTITHDLPDRAYQRPDQIPDAKFREDMNRRCPELRDSFVGPMDRQYFEDRKRWTKEYGKFWKEGHKND